MGKLTTIDQYIAAFPSDVQNILNRIRRVIREAAPMATEAMAYGIPTFKLHGNLIHFGGFSKHVSLFPGPIAIEVFRDELGDYALSKGTIQFRLDKPIPYELVEKITKYRVMEQLEKHE